MYQHILMPLDGSDLAERVLPHVQKLVTTPQETRITLLRSLAPVHPIMVAEAETEARRYMGEIAAQLMAAGFRVSIEISILPAAEAIIDYTEQNNVDLIAIATHGRSGVGRWLLGSVTQKVIQATPVPALVIRPH